MIERSIETTADIFSSIPPRRIWLGRVAAGGVMLFFIFVFLPIFDDERSFFLWAGICVLLALFSLFTKVKPKPWVADRFLLGIGLITIPQFAFLAFASFIEILDFFLPSISFWGDLREHLRVLFLVIFACSAFVAPVWLIFILFCAKTVFRIYRSRLFYWSLVLSPLIVVLASNLITLIALLSFALFSL